MSMKINRLFGFLMAGCACLSGVVCVPIGERGPTGGHLDFSDATGVEVNRLLTEMERGKGDKKDEARSGILGYGPRAVPYLAEILRKRADSSDWRQNGELVLSNKYGVIIFEPSRSKARNDHAGSAAVMLSQLGKSGVGVLVSASTDERNSFQVRWRALIGLRYMEAQTSPLVANALLSCLADRSGFVRFQAVTLIGLFGGRSALPEVSRLIDDPDPEVRKAAREAIPQLDSRSSAGANDSTAVPVDARAGTSESGTEGDTRTQTGRNPVRIVNPNAFSVDVELRSQGRSRLFTVSSQSSETVFVANGTYDVFFVYSSDPGAQYQGDSFSLKDNGVEIRIVKAVDGNFGIRRVR